MLDDLLHPERRWHDTNGPYFGRPTIDDMARAAERFIATANVPVAERSVPRSSLAIETQVDGQDRLVGSVSWYWECEATDWRRLGIVLYDESVWGNGLATEALRLWVSYLFDVTDSLRLDLATYSANSGMIAVARKLGFVEEARLRKARRWAGGIHDSVIYGILREEWQRGQFSRAMAAADSD